jgi:hypothetical protein
MIEKVFILFTTLTYSLLMSQYLFYWLCLKKAQLEVDAHSYITFRHVINRHISKPLKILFILVLLLNIIALIISMYNHSRITAGLFTGAVICIMIDMWLAVKVSIPINHAMDKWTTANYPTNWTEYRLKWFHIFRYRQIIGITGFLLFLVAINI